MKKSVLCFINHILNMIEETETNASLQDFADDVPRVIHEIQRVIEVFPFIGSL